MNKIIEIVGKRKRVRYKEMNERLNKETNENIL